MKATGTCQFTYDYGDMWEQYYTSVENKKEVQFKIAPLVIFCNSVIYFTSSNLTYADNQRFTKVLVQIWNTISILDVVPQ